MKEQIAPHGGTLVNRVASSEEAQEWSRRAAELPSLGLNSRQISDLEMIGTGGLSPLRGFMGQADYRGCVEEMHLASCLPWAIPVTLAAGEAEANALQIGQDVALQDSEGRLLGILHLAEKFRYDKEEEARRVY